MLISIFLTGCVTANNNSISRDYTLDKKSNMGVIVMSMTIGNQDTKKSHSHFYSLEVEYNPLGHKDQAGTIKANIELIPSNTNHIQGKKYGILIVQELKAGKYEVSLPVLSQFQNSNRDKEDGNSFYVYSPLKSSVVTFTVTAGEITYLGEYGALIHGDVLTKKGYGHFSVPPSHVGAFIMTPDGPKDMQGNLILPKGELFPLITTMYTSSELERDIKILSNEHPRLSFEQIYTQVAHRKTSNVKASKGIMRKHSYFK